MAWFSILQLPAYIRSLFSRKVSPEEQRLRDLMLASGESCERAVNSIHVQLGQQMRNAHAEYAYLLDTALAINAKRKIFTPEEKANLVEMATAHMTFLKEASDNLLAAHDAAEAEYIRRRAAAMQVQV